MLGMAAAMVGLAEPMIWNYVANPAEHFPEGEKNEWRKPGILSCLLAIVNILNNVDNLNGHWVQSI